MGKSTTDSFSLTVPLFYSDSQQNRMDKMFRCTCTCKNNLIAEKKDALDALEQSDEWKELQAAISKTYEELKPLEAIEVEKRTKEQKKAIADITARQKGLFNEKDELLKHTGFTEYAFQASMIRYRSHYPGLVDANVAQTEASNVWRMFEDYFFGKGKNIHFTALNDFTSIAGKSNRQGIVYQDGYVRISTKGYTHAKQSSAVPAQDSPSDPNVASDGDPEENATASKKSNRKPRPKKARVKRKAKVRRWVRKPPKKHRSPSRRKKQRFQEARTNMNDHRRGTTGKPKHKSGKCPFNPEKFMVLKVKTPLKAKAKTDPSARYELDCLKHRVKFCRIVRRIYRDGWHYFLQLVLEGVPPVKINPETGEPLHPLGEGTVGIDPGPRVWAFSARKHVLLQELAEGVKSIHSKIQVVVRAMDRSRRAMNPWAYDQETGQIIPVEKLDPKHLTKNRKRRWVNSKHYQRLHLELRVLNRMRTEWVRQKHHELANIVVGFGDDFRIEKMDWPALNKRAKKTTINPKTKRYRCKKRFGSSARDCSPASFEKILMNAVLKRGGKFHYIDTVACKASQFNHITGEYIKSALSEREKMIGPYWVQRDMYSAHLIEHTNSTYNGYNIDDLIRDFFNFRKLMIAEVRRLQKEQQNGKRLRRSTGITPSLFCV